MNNKIKQFCKDHNLTENQFYGKEEFSGYLYLRSLTSIPEGFNPTVGGYLYLGSLTSIPEGFNPTVGGNLYLESGLSAETKPYGNPIIKFQNGKYIKADGMFTEVLDKKGNVYTVRNLNSEKVFYLATDGKNTHAHGDTIEQAKTDLRFKKIADKLKSAPIKANTMINVQHYRIVTGACESGCRQWLEQNKITATEIKASDLIILLEKTNAYGAEKFKSLLTA